MIQLLKNDIPKNILDGLEKLQNGINAEPTFPKKVKKAQALWNSKGGRAGKELFKTICSTLYDMCVYVGVCNYCEQNEANDVEHIYPKSFFPEHTFVWENYLLACKQCNSAYKLDKCFIIDDHDEVQEVKRKSEPPFKLGAFINPRIEDPNDYLVLSLLTYKFEILPDLTKQQFNKSIKTLDILELNNRDTLLAARRNAAIYFYHRLQLLIRILDADSIAEIEELLTPNEDRVNTALSLDKLKLELKDNFRNHIVTYQHPSVWKSIKLVESKINPKWQVIFAKLPEAIDW
jgi:uncharacterized protein (TIGR02646 family)